MSRSSSPSAIQCEPSSPGLRVVGHANSLRPPAKAAPRDSGEREAVRRFIRARRKLGLSQFGAAERLGVSDTSVSDWERGAARMPAWALAELERLAA